MIADKISDDHRINELLAARIHSFWARQGYSVATIIIPAKQRVLAEPHGHDTVYGIRSDMRSGWPAGRAP